MLTTRCPWYIAGPILGVLIVALRATINRPLGALGGYIEVADSAARPSRLGFSTFLLAGIVLGGAAFALLSGTFFPTPVYDGLLPADPTLRLSLLSAAGIAMGLGARTAGGCTSGHGLTGMSLGSPASIVAAMTFFGTAVALAHVTAWLRGSAGGF